jgi:hypothetical protein
MEEKKRSNFLKQDLFVDVGYGSKNKTKIAVLNPYEDADFLEMFKEAKKQHFFSTLMAYFLSFLKLVLIFFISIFFLFHFFDCFIFLCSDLYLVKKHGFLILNI